MITFRTHCSGGELFGVGARQAGYRHIDGFEIDAKIAAVARLNGFDVHTSDVCQVEYTTLPPADHFHTSPSCKRASRANTNQGLTPQINGNGVPCLLAQRIMESLRGVYAS